MAKNKYRAEEWVTIPKFIEHYDLSSATAYRLIHAKGFPSQRVSKRAYRVDLSKTDEYFRKLGEC
jgi:predicted DNA-binding transcriptional regulator AlpA